MKLLHLLRSKHTFFKKVRIGFSLLRSSFKTVFFNHHDYFFFSILLAVIQFIHVELTGLIHHRLTPSVVITELLAGEGFFDILRHDGQITLSMQNWLSLLGFTLLLYLEIILTFFVLSATAHYALTQKKNTIYKSIQKSLTHWRTLCVWGLFELCAQGTSSFLDNRGALLYFVWNIVTIFDVQIISFDRINAFRVLKKSWQLFKQNMSEVVALDIIIEGALIATGFFIYSVSKWYISGIHLTESDSYNGIIVFLMLYLISSVMTFETVLFTKLYQERAEEKR